MEIGIYGATLRRRWIDVCWWQRRILAPAFNSAALKEMYPTFVQKAEELRDRWDKLIDASCSSVPYPAPGLALPPCDEEKNVADSSSIGDVSHDVILDVWDWMNRAALDVIGLAGFGYRFNSLADRREEVSTAFREMMDAVEKLPGLKGMFALWFPIIEDILVGCLRSFIERGVTDLCVLA